MTKNDIKLLKVFGAPISYYTLTKDTVKKLDLRGDVTFECDKAYDSKFRLKAGIFANNEQMKVVDDLVVIRNGNNTRVITDKDLFNFPDDASEMFYGCDASSLDLSKFDTSQVTNMNNMFSNCHAISLDLSNFDTSQVTNMSQMFFSCDVKSLDLSKFNTSNVTAMLGMFSNCQAKSLDLRNFDTSQVMDMREMFRDCKAEFIDVSNFDKSNVIRMEEMFADCHAIVKGV